MELSERLSKEWQERMRTYKQLLANGTKADLAEVPQHIVSSWLRSRGYGISIECRAMEFEPRERVKELLERNSELGFVGIKNIA